MDNNNVYIDPPYSVYYQNRLFDKHDKVLNRDDSLVPYIRLKEALADSGRILHTADYLPETNASADYYSVGVMSNFQRLSQRADVRLRAFIIMEPPVVQPALYQALPDITAAFDEVYLHNTAGVGYSLHGVDQSKLRQLYWPQPINDVRESFWNNPHRQRRIVVINGNHIPRSRTSELYSKRIKVMADLAEHGLIDLYGRGWERWWSRASMWWPYWRHRRALMSIYKGACDSKYEVLSQYHFSLCFENMSMSGYVTEKIFDCLYAGTVPLYLGAPDIAELIPADAYIDCRNFGSWQEMQDQVMALSDARIAEIRNAGRQFLRSEAGQRYYNSLLEVFHV